MLLPVAVADPGFSRRGGGGGGERQPPRRGTNLLFGQFFPENCIKMNEITKLEGP